MNGVPVVIHGHFYQPPRSDPWTHEVPQELSAAPFHNWNERILEECYRPLTQAPLVDGEGRVRALVNTLEWISWDAGATLLNWLVREDPATLAAFVEADQRSRRRWGFGNAIAAPYHHIILPLASPRDRQTEVRWGIRDFRRRFGRDPDGLWLPETAVDVPTLETLAAEGIAYTVLAPHQLVQAPDTGGAGRVALPSGRSIAVFSYHGALAHGVAFGAELRDAWRWVDGMARIAAEPGRELVSLATDGETFGHHQPWGDLALAAALERIDSHHALRLDNFASFLHRCPLAHEVEVVELTSWSCAHGVERWRSDCGCRAHPEQARDLSWKAPLRESLEQRATAVHKRFVAEVGPLFEDPWQLRDDWIETSQQAAEARLAWLRARALRPLAPGEAERVLMLLEAERDALRMFTSCAWFFDDPQGLETQQVLRYARHAQELVEQRPQAPVEPPTVLKPQAPAASAAAAAPARTPIYARPVAPLVAAVRDFVRAPSVDRAQQVMGEVLRPRSSVGELAAARRLLARSLDLGPDWGPDWGPGTPVPPVSARAPAVTQVARALGFAPEALEGTRFGGAGPLPFVFGLHLHQPLGNFERVVREHCDDVYLPLLQQLTLHGVGPLTLHVSGPLLEWLEQRAHPLIDVIGRGVTDGAIELLTSGLYEPILVAIPRVERAEQVEAMTARLKARFGVAPHGLWLTERVWEPELIDDLSAAGVHWSFVDDRHIEVTGVPVDRIAKPWTTTSPDGGELTLLPISSPLRYLVPFHPVSELEAHLRRERARGARLGILCDDGEKFGGWPDTREWVWTRGWLDDFCRGIERLRLEGRLELLTGSKAIAQVPPDACVHVPSASYQEMEAWALPPDATRALEAAGTLLAQSEADQTGARFLRGGHWRNFLTRYPEAARMQAKADALSALARHQGAPPEVRDLIARARCNDAYWHGVFGGLYLRHLRGEIWRQLARAEGRLRKGASLSFAPGPGLGGVGRELNVHSSQFSAVIALDRGGALVEWLDFGLEVNVADVLTRRWEHAHRVQPKTSDLTAAPTQTTSLRSIHEREGAITLPEVPAIDADERHLTAERIVSESVTAEQWQRADYTPIRSWGRDVAQPKARRPDATDAAESTDAPQTLSVSLALPGWGDLHKTLTFEHDGALHLTWRWDAGAFPPDALFTVELSVASPIELRCDPQPLAIWRYDIVTWSRSESGVEPIVQGESITPSWPVSAGACAVWLRVERRD